MELDPVDQQIETLQSMFENIDSNFRAMKAQAATRRGGLRVLLGAVIGPIVAI